LKKKRPEERRRKNKACWKKIGDRNRWKRKKEKLYLRIWRRMRYCGED
jgi:hypothetical protein